MVRQAQKKRKAESLKRADDDDDDDATVASVKVEHEEGESPTLVVSPDHSTLSLIQKCPGLTCGAMPRM